MTACTLPATTVTPTATNSSLHIEPPPPVITARDAVLDFMREGAIISVPGKGAPWKSDLGPSIKGYEVYQFSGNDVILTVSYPLEETEETLYHVTLNNAVIGVCWQANVNYKGDILTTGLEAQMLPEFVTASAEYCQSQGYQYEPNLKDEEKQCGTCTFPDGSTCNAWGYYQGFCQPGDHLTED